MFSTDVTFHTSFIGQAGTINFSGSDGWTKTLDTSGVFTIPQEKGMQTVLVSGNAPDHVTVEIRSGGIVLAKESYMGTFNNVIHYGVNNGGPR